MPKQRSWTDDQLRAAVATSATYRQILRALGLQNGSLRYVQTCIAELGLDVSHLPKLRSAEFCTDDVLRAVVARARSSTEVLKALDLEPFGNNFHRVRRRIRMLGLDTSHFTRKRNDARTRWSDDDLRTAVASSFGYSESIRKLGLIPAGGNYVQVQRRIRELELDTSHFRGRGWNVEAKYIRPVERPLEEVLVANAWTASHRLKLRLFRAGRKTPACEQCGWAERRPSDGVIPVELDHINGDKDDNRIENLRILCPNCHSLQPTHRGLNQRRRKK